MSAPIVSNTSTQGKDPAFNNNKYENRRKGRKRKKRGRRAERRKGTEQAR